MWGKEDCALDVDCRRYRDHSPRYTDNYTCVDALRGEPETLETKWWRADACRCRQPPRSTSMDSENTESDGDGVNTVDSSSTKANATKTHGILSNIFGTATKYNEAKGVSVPTKPKKELGYTLVCEPCGCGGTVNVDFKTLGPVNSLKQCMDVTTADSACLTKTFTYSSRNRQCWCRLHDRCPHPQQYPDHKDWVVYRAGMMGTCVCFAL